MKNNTVLSTLIKSVALLLFIFVSSSIYAQTRISGVVTESSTGEPLVGVNILVKGKVIGTITEFDGSFSLQVQTPPPLTLVISYVGFTTQELEITESTVENLEIKLEEQFLLGQEVVISASKIEESILESPVSIEKMDILDIQNTPSDSYYKALANLKGVDVTTSSINFQIVNARGFGNTGNTRFVQLIDGMDTQAPALNFPIGNLNGPSELDVESLELIPGASSALYGPNAFNGVLLINSKNPFEYQGLSAFAKTGVNHIGPNADQQMAPTWEGAIRYAKAFNDNFAFKVNFSYMKADDWHGTDATDREEFRTPAGFSFNPGSDRLHYMGDEASINMAIFPLSTSWQTIADGRIFAPGLTALTYANAGDLPSHVVSITPYLEEHLIDYGAENIKGNLGLYYRINESMELSYLFNAGYGTSIYTGAQRYSLNNFNIMQHRIQLRGDNFNLKAYTTRENSGDSYITEFLAKRIFDQSSNGNGVSYWLGSYAINYIEYLNNQGYQPGDINNFAGTQAELIALQENAHNYARTKTDEFLTYDPNSPEFALAKEKGLEGVVPYGPKFNDNTNMYHVEGQYDFKNDIEFMNLQAGAVYRMFDLNSNGTIFADLDNTLTIKEYGAYLLGGKNFADDKLKLSGSIRYDKNENFEGQVNPRFSAVVKVAKNHNIRASYQTGFRVPTTQGQHIDLNIISARLLGGLPQYYEKYGLTDLSTTGNPRAYEGYSVQQYSTAVFDQGATTAAMFNPANLALLKPVTTYQSVKPEQVQSMEIGYKSLINNNLMIDFSYYFNIYHDFISQVRIRKAKEFTNDLALSQSNEIDYSYHPDPAMEGQINYGTLLNGTADNTFQIYTNINDIVTSQGLALGLDYSLLKGYSLTGNYSWNVINNVPEGFLSEFNTPEHKFNVGFGNRKLTDNLGFNVTYRWQSEFWWESSFTISRNGMVPQYGTMDAQITYKLEDLKSKLKIGGSNILNKQYIQSLGGPNIGALFYVSLTFDELMN